MLHNALTGDSRDLPALYGRDSYVLITGASDGIGRYLAVDFARRGFNIIIIGRSADKLAQTEKLVKEAAPSRKVIIVIYDFSKVDQLPQNDFGAAFKLDFSKIDVSVLVNNVGISQENRTVA